jgi:hypothetical protein
MPFSRLAITGKILIDCTNPLAPDLSGLVLGTTTSAGEEIARLAKSTKVVKAFNTIGAANFENPRFGSERASMFICGEDPAAKKVAAKLASELDFDVVDVGPLLASRWLEPLAMGDAVDSSGIQTGPWSHRSRLQAAPTLSHGETPSRSIERRRLRSCDDAPRVWFQIGRHPRLCSALAPPPPLASIDSLRPQFRYRRRVWVAHHSYFYFIMKVNWPLLWLDNVFLMTVAFLPFPASLLGEYPDAQASTILYGCTLIVANIFLALSWLYADRSGAVSNGIPEIQEICAGYNPCPDCHISPDGIEHGVVRELKRDLPVRFRSFTGINPI